MQRVQDVKELCIALDGKLVALHCYQDPITNEVDIHFFTDDGRGNGDHIASMSLEYFVQGNRQHNIDCGLGDSEA